MVTLGMYRAGGLDLRFEPCHLHQPLIPPALQLANDHPVFWLDCIVLPASARRLVARLLQCQPKLVETISAGLLALGRRFQSRLDRQRRYHAQHFSRDRCVNAHIAKRYAFGPSAVIGRGVDTQVAGNAAKAIVVNFELATTMPAAQQSNRYTSPVAYPAGHHCPLHIGVLSDQALVAFILVPADGTMKPRSFATYSPMRCKTPHVTKMTKRPIRQREGSGYRTGLQDFGDAAVAWIEIPDERVNHVDNPTGHSVLCFSTFHSAYNGVFCFVPFDAAANDLTGRPTTFG